MNVCKKTPNKNLNTMIIILLFSYIMSFYPEGYIKTELDLKLTSFRIFVVRPEVVTKAAMLYVCTGPPY